MVKVRVKVRPRVRLRLQLSVGEIGRISIRNRIRGQESGLTHSYPSTNPIALP
jgi:hypothetical protein